MRCSARAFHPRTPARFVKCGGQFSDASVAADSEKPERLCRRKGNTPMPAHATRPGAQVEEQAHDTPRYRVLLHHDGLHAARYVGQVLQDVFYFNQHGAEEIMSEARYNGVALCTIEPLEEAKCHAEKLTSAKLTATIELES